jgi:hypothetical protein
MPAYVIAETDIRGPEQYELYRAATPAAIAAGRAPITGVRRNRSSGSRQSPTSRFGRFVGIGFGRRTMRARGAGGRSPGGWPMRAMGPQPVAAGGAAQVARQYSQRAYLGSWVFISSNSSTMRSRYQSLPPWTMSVPRTVGVALSLVSP